MSVGDTEEELFAFAHAYVWSPVSFWSGLVRGSPAFSGNGYCLVYVSPVVHLSWSQAWCHVKLVADLLSLCSYILPTCLIVGQKKESRGQIHPQMPPKEVTAREGHQSPPNQRLSQFPITSPSPVVVRVHPKPSWPFHPPPTAPSTPPPKSTPTTTLPPQITLLSLPPTA